VNAVQEYMRAYHPYIPGPISVNRVDGLWANIIEYPLDPNRAQSAMVIFAQADDGRWELAWGPGTALENTWITRYLPPSFLDGCQQPH
jgi:hypothetical protein